MFLLVSAHQHWIHCPRIAIQQHILIALVTDWHVLHQLLRLVSDVHLNPDQYFEVINVLVDWLRLNSDLNMSVLEQGVLFLEVACNESSYSLFFAQLFHHFLQVFVRFNQLSIILFVPWVRVWWGCECLWDFTFWHWFSEFCYVTFPETTCTSLGFAKAFVFW